MIPWASGCGSDYGWWGQALVLGLVTAVILPVLAALVGGSWSRLRAGLDWLSRRDLLSRGDVLAVLLGVPLLFGLPLIILARSLLPHAEFAVGIVLWLIHLAALAALVGIGRQLAGSRFHGASGR
ncbi:MAG: hypothetical protein IPH82_13395 [Chloroflexi bacterium]|nr:hypothetical protein [Chloroflexota bacterium]